MKKNTALPTLKSTCLGRCPAWTATGYCTREASVSNSVRQADLTADTASSYWMYHLSTRPNFTALLIALSAPKHPKREIAPSGLNLTDHEISETFDCLFPKLLSAKRCKAIFAFLAHKHVTNSLVTDTPRIRLACQSINQVETWTFGPKFTHARDTRTKRVSDRVQIQKSYYAEQLFDQ